ncbi:MAG: phospholipid scramblase-related protein [Acidimicrobiales bacterium]
MSQQGPAGGPAFAQQHVPQQQHQDQQRHAPGWYPDPYGRHETRWFDGNQWTEHVASHGRQSVDAPTGGGHVPTVNRATDKIVRDVQKAGGAAAPQGGGTIFTEPVLVVNQKAKLIEVNNEYAIYSQNGQQIGAVRQVGQSMAKKALRVMTKLDSIMTHKLQIVDGYGNVVLALTKPSAMLKQRVIVQDAAGNEIGQIAMQLRLGKARFNLESGGRQLGVIHAENFRAWNFSVQDHASNEIARITKTWEGMAKAMFTTADNYVVQIHRPLEEPLRSLVVASSLTVDLILKQMQH